MRLLQGVCYKAGGKTWEVELEAVKESENHLPDSLAEMASEFPWSNYNI